MDRRTTKTTHYSLVALLCVLIVTFALGMGGVATAGQDVAKTDAVSGFSKVGNFDMETLRQQYFSQTAVQETTASYSGKRWVIVELEGDSLFTSYENRGYWYGDFTTYCNSEEGKLLKADIEASHKDFLAVLDNNRIDYKYKYSYSTLNNGVALKVDADTFNEIKKLDGVKSVYYSESYAIPTVAVSNNANVYTTGIYDSSNLSYKGEGMVVAVLDTGLDYSHEAFSTMPSNPAWTKEYVAAKMAASTRFNAQATVDEVYYNSKVPFAYDYADDDADVYPSYSTHGTHVAGIVAGKSDYVVNKETDETFVGVAPEAQLVICKVFTDNLDSDSLGGADTIDIIAAVSDCVELGVDVINMSLGSSAGFSDEKSDELINEVYNRVRAAGISLVVAASNDYSSGFGGGNGTNLASNPDSGTVGSPSTYGAALSVASINGQKATFIQSNNDENQVAFITESSDANGNEYDFVERLYNIAGKSKGDTLNFKYVVVGGVGRATNYTSKIRRELQDKTGYDGTIALIKRGDTTFADKVQTAMDNGADAVIIYNNLSGTIRMSLGDVNNPVPTCSIPMDAGKVFVEKADKGVGSVQINSEFKAGPFMSDFSSWGPTPDLQLKPEITAHGGEITSAVPGGYDVYSGTSMAAPNMSGAVALLRQHLKTANPTLTGVELNARVNQVLMSTATIALNDEGNPYSPRKQGAGLAGIADAINAESFITVKDKDGNVRDKTKVELYDDKQKTGIYEFEFTINNISGKIEQYDPTVYVMTETLASDNKTVAEKAYMLSDSTIEYVVDGAPHTGSISVGADMTTTVKVKITLSQAARNYLDKSFKNGMYVEGFVSLKGADTTKVTIGLPYLAFYGDWTDAPLFDYSTYELAESQKDTNVPAEDKLVASAADTKVIGMYFDDKYILQLGAYLYEMDESEVKIYPEKEKAAVSMFDNRGQRTIYEVYMVYAGLLRGAAYMNVEIKDAATGQVIYTERQENISKSYAAGGSNRAAAIQLEIKPSEWNLLNNGTYYVSLKGELDYPGGENPDRNSFDFQFTVDYEAPQMLDYRIRYESYTENKKVKYRIYMDVDVVDNQYVQDVMPCYVKTERGQRTLTLLTEHPIPVYGGQGQKSTVSFDITDIYEDYIKTGKMYIAVEDYAMNQSTYIINAQAGLDYPETVLVSDADGRLIDTEETGKNTSGEASYNGIYGKDVDGITYYGDSQYIYGLVGETSTTYVYVDANKDSHYATISGELAANSIITVSYGEGKSVVFTITKVAKATADGSFKQASSERGTYNGDKGAIFLDGFGKATVDGAAYSYYINGANVVVLSNETATIGVTIDTEIGVYLEKTTDGKAQIFTQSGSTYYTFELDGFGGVNYIYKSSYSTSITRGTYEFSQDGATVTIAKVNSDVNGTYNIQDSGKVLVESTSERKVFIAKGYTVTTHEQEFVGYYVDAKGKAIEITIEDGRIWLAIAGTNKRLTKNWNGTVLSYSAKDDDAAEGYTNIYSDYTLTLVGGNVVISHGCVTGYDSSYEEYLREPKSVTYTKTEKPFAFPESARGTWYLDDNTVVVIAEKSITVGGVEGADYNVTESMFGTNYEFSIGGKKYMVYEDAVTAGKWYYCAADSYDAIELSKTEHAATLDAFAGTWKWNSLTFTFDGKGNVTVIGAYDGTYTYTVDAAGTTATFRNTAYSEDITCKLNSDGTMTVNDQSSEWINNAKFAKEETTTGGAAVTADMQGTYTGTNGYTTNYTLIVGENSIVYKEVDSSWGVNINDTITDYTISEDGYTITWTKSGTTYKFMDTGFAYKLYVGTDDYTLTKQA